MLFKQINHLRGFSQGAYKRNHHFDVGETHLIANPLQCLTFKRETVTKILGDIARCATKPEHRILFMGLIGLATEQVGVLITLKI